MLGRDFLGISGSQRAGRCSITPFNSTLQHKWVWESPLGWLWGSALGGISGSLHPKDLNTASPWHHCLGQEKLLPQEQPLSTRWSLKFPSEAAGTFLPFLSSYTGTGEEQKAAMKWGGGVEKFNIHPSKDKTSLSRQTPLAGAGPSHYWREKAENLTFNRLRMFPWQIPLYLHWEGCVTYLLIRAKEKHQAVIKQSFFIWLIRNLQFLSLKSRSAS